MESARQTLDASLAVDPQLEIERICRWMQVEVSNRGSRGVVLGLSGGLDSTTCAFLCARCFPANRIHLVSLPERDSAAAPARHARQVAQTLHLALAERDISPLVRELGVYQQVTAQPEENRPVYLRALRILRLLSGDPIFFPWAQEYAFSRRRGVLGWLLRKGLWSYAARTELFIFGKLRARMAALSLQAMQLDCLLICTTDRSEWSIGFYDPHGDGVGDLAPLRHLYKTQIRQVARAAGVPEEIIRQPSSGDLAAGLPNEAAIGLSYEQLDRILAGFSLQLPDEQTASGAGVSNAVVKAVRTACAVADQRRRAPVGVESSRPEDPLEFIHSSPPDRGSAADPPGSG